jgi:hypothetical protein
MRVDATKAMPFASRVAATDRGGRAFACRTPMICARTTLIKRPGYHMPPDAKALTRHPHPFFHWLLTLNLKP